MQYNFLKKISPLFFYFTHAISANNQHTLNEDSFRTAATYMRNIYHDILEDLKKGHSIQRQTILTAFENDPLLTAVPGATGHRNFRCHLLGITFGIVNHGPNPVKPEARKSFHRDIQIYINVIKLFEQKNEDHLALSLQNMNIQSWRSLYEDESNKFEIYSKEK